MISVSVPGCGPGLVADCNGNCAPVSWFSDAYCDNGFYRYNGVPINFNCAQFNYDGGACNTNPPPIQQPPNHGAPATPPAYQPPSPPQPQQNKLILVTHGWNTSYDTYAAFWAPLRNAIAARVGPDWNVESYDWTSDSGVVNPVFFNPDYALTTGAIHGRYYGETVVTRGFTHVHFIAHSAGSAFIAAAAKRIKELSSNITIQMTFLDAFAGPVPGFPNVFEAYGRDADWADQYFTPAETSDIPGYFTEMLLPNAFNLDVSRVDPNYPHGGLFGSFGSHTWPRCFYRSSVDGGAVEACDPPIGDILPYGFDLSFERWTGPGGFAGWKAARLAEYPPGELRSLAGGSGGSGTQINAPQDPPENLSGLPAYQNSADGVHVTADSLTMTTMPPGSSTAAPAWINFQLTTTQPANFLAFDMSIADSPGAAGVVTVFVDGSPQIKIDEVYKLPGTQSYKAAMPGELPPGDHIIGFRLDTTNGTRSNITVSNVATGRYEIVPACPSDFNRSGGTPDDADIAAFFAAWNNGDDSADLNRSGGTPDDADVAFFFVHWNNGC